MDRRIPKLASTLAVAVLGLAMLAEVPPVGAVRAPQPGIGVLGPDGADAYARAGIGPLVPLLHRMSRYFHAHEVEGVTMDSRYPINPSEAIRMSVVSQLLGYCELDRVHTSAVIQTDIAERARYLIARLDSVSSGTPFDGMLGYSLLEAYERTGLPDILAGSNSVTAELEAIPTSQCILNGGLMVAMAMAEAARVSGDAVASQKAHDILTLLPPYQNSDGSFPHWCPGSRDIHYTGWMSQELILIQRMNGDPRIEPILSRMRTFMEGRVGADGRSSYQDPCTGAPACTSYYYSRATGCSYDYDTRGWTVEPGYQSLLFSHYGSPDYLRVLRFLLSLENDGTFPDLYGWWPPPSDPEYPWTIADTSVANMSIIFWSLATALSGRGDRAVQDSLWIARGTPGDPEDTLVSAPAALEVAPQGRVRASPAPIARLGPRALAEAGAPCAIRFVLSRRARVGLEVFDAAGRRVRQLLADDLDAGPHATLWDARDERGRAVRPGLYWLRLSAGGEPQDSGSLVLR